MTFIYKWIMCRLGKWTKGLLREATVFLAIMTLLAFLPGPVGQWGFNFWISVDQLVNSLTLGDPDETISSRVGKWSVAEDPGMFRSTVSGTLCFFLDRRWLHALDLQSATP